MNLQNRKPTRRSLLSELNENFPWDLGRRKETDQAQWVPRADVYATDREFVFEMDLPGVDRNDVTLNVDDNQLTISGKRVKETSDDESMDDRTYHRLERYEGSFERAYVLPDGVDADAITARYDNGTLTIEVPKPEHSETKKREISID